MGSPVLWVVIYAQPQDAALSPTVDFQKNVHTVFAARCLSCHSAERRSGGLSLAAYADALDGGRSGAAVRPGDAAGSLLMLRITGEMTPPMPLDRPALRRRDGDDRRWIDEGARETIASAAAKPMGSAARARAAGRPRRGLARLDDPVDRFVAAISEHGAREPELVGDAAFARRAYLDIWGLLPPPEDLRRFSQTGPNKRSRSCNVSLLTTTSTPNTGSRSGTICCGTTKGSTTTRRRPRARASAPGCCRR